MAYIKASNDIEINEPEPKLKSPKKFTEYYADPEYRRKHQAYMKTKISCPECGRVTVRSNMAAHKRTLRHAEVAKISGK